MSYVAVGKINELDNNTFSLQKNKRKFYIPKNLSKIKRGDECVIIFNQKEKKRTVKVKNIYCLFLNNILVFSNHCVEKFSGSLIYADNTGFVMQHKHNGGQKNFKYPPIKPQLKLHYEYEIFYREDKISHALYITV